MSVNTSTQTTPPFQGSLEQVSEQLGTCTARAMIDMISFTEKVQANYQNDRDILNQGIWYPDDYVLALKKTDQVLKINMLRENGYLLNGYMSEELFGPIYSMPGVERSKRPWTFRALFTELSSVALKTAMQGFAILDCGAVCQMARYKALNDVLGDERFNRLFSKPHGIPLNIEYTVDDELQPMMYFISFTESAFNKIKGTLNHRPVEVGQLTAFSGIPTYRYKHVNNVFRNFNVICTDATPGKQKFVAHGLSSKGETEQQIAQRFVDAFNAKPDHFSRVPFSERLEIEEVFRTPPVESLKNQQIHTTDPISVVQGYLPNTTQGYQVELIYDLTRTPLEKISIDFVKNHASANQIPTITEEEIFRRQTKLN